MGVLASNSWRSHTRRGGGTNARDRVEDRRLAGPLDIRLRPWAFRPGIGLLPLSYIAVATCALLQPTD